MSFINNVRDLFQAKPQATIAVLSIAGGADYAELPRGFFRVECASGKESLGYNGSFLSWDVGETVVDGGRRITLEKPSAELPLVKLNFRQQTDGLQQVEGTSLIDTDSLEVNDGTVTWAGAVPRNGVDYV